MAAPFLIAGMCTATFNGIDIGLTAKGFSFHAKMHSDPIHGDMGGSTPLDEIEMGGEVEVTLDSIEYDKMIAVVAATAGADNPVWSGTPMDNVGKLLSNRAKALILTPVAGRGATKRLTATKAVCTSDIEFMMNNGLKQGPVTFKLLPDTSLVGADYGRTHKWDVVVV